ncbi:MAG TPA: hypothetical protein VHS59_07150 [Bacillota bacterium]|nr:hypothetical protein [Bacillota bacterium]
MAKMKVLSREQVKFFKDKAKQAANARGLEILDSEVRLTADGKVKVTTHYAPSSIERVRRVTGYFCKLSNCNEAKLQEISQRVVHQACGLEG